MDTVLSIDQISKNYGRIRALDNVSFSVPQGSVFGILGPNGSGKTTMLGILTGVLNATAGHFSWFGQPPSEKQRQRIGTLLETPNFYHYLSGDRNLKIAAAIKQHGKNDTDKVLSLVRLLERKDSKFSTYSLGMKQRLAIGSCLLGDPPVLVFDEPTNGLDPAGIAEIRQLIRQLSQEGKTIILASHLLDEVEKVCTHVAILQRGKLVTAGKVNEVLVNEEWAELRSADLSQLELVIKSWPDVKKTAITNGYVYAYFENLVPDLAALNQFCFERGVTLNHIVVQRKSLEAKFIEITNNVSN